MPGVHKFESVCTAHHDFMPTKMFTVVLTRDEIATITKAALLWNVHLEKALELTINGGILILREVLPSPANPRPPEIR